MKRYILRIIDSVVTMLLILVFLFAVVVIVSVMSTPKGEPPMIFGRTMLQVTSPSMEPELKIGTVVMVKKAETSEVKEGDIISFYTRDPDIYNSVVTHRVVEAEERNDGVVLTTKGDANVSNDKYPVKNDRMIGVVTGVSDVIGSFVMLLSYKWVFALFIIVPMLYIVISNGYKLISSARKGIPKDGEEQDNGKE